MAHEIIATVRVALSDDPAEMAGALGEIAAAWSEFLAAFDQYSASRNVEFVVNQTRTRSSNGTGRRGRRRATPAEPAQDMLA